MLYWINNDIGSTKGTIRKHQFHALDQFSQKTIATLLEKSVVRVIDAPSIRVMPELKKYVILLEKVGISTLLDLLIRKSDVSGITKLSEKEVQALVTKAESMLRPDTSANG
jgi:hypothetical protein